MSEETAQSIFGNCTLATIDGNATSILQCIAESFEQRISEAQTVGSDLGNALDTFYLIWAGAMVFFMQTGFAMLCAGSIRAKNVKNVVLWNLLDSCGGGVAFWAVGFAFAYGGDDPTNPEKTFIGNSEFFLGSFSAVPLQFWFFQWTFACALSSIVAGTIAERTQMKAYLLYSSFLVGFVYPVVAHAFWSPQGFLSKFAVNKLFGSGAIDLAGSGAVHMCGGVAALVGGIILGPRIGRFHDRDGNLLDEPVEIPPHSTALQFLGTFALWFGWYGFNPGSVLSIENYAPVAALVAMNTTLAACTGAVSAMFLSSWYDHRTTGIFSYDVVSTMNGCLSGLVAITSGCATVDTWAAAVIGLFAGLFYLIGSKTLIHFRFDDAVDAVPVHMVGGAWGMIATGLFTSPSLLEAAYGPSDHVGWFYEWSQGSGDFALLGAQLIAVLFVFGWSFFVMGAWFFFLNLAGWLRIDPFEEEAGMDISRHKGSAYEITAVNQDVVDQLSLSRSQHNISIDNSQRSKIEDLKDDSKDGHVGETEKE